jgi:hypothetical protein
MTLDYEYGTETTHTGPRVETVVAKASWEGETLAFVSARTLSLLENELSANSKGMRCLSPDGTTLTVDAEIQSPWGDQRVNTVFAKQ